mmetsp:Transcript_55926/g.173395  ORF Transcript_55926/g.173395 Transcript_55926/m.173395 type:complete len:210 (+) Transcript_55926:804-1433(+)
MLLWRVALLRRRPADDRLRHGPRERAGDAPRLLHRHRGRHHGNHARRARHQPPGHRCVEARRAAGPHGGQLHRERHRQQLRERLPGPGPPLDHSSHLLGDEGAHHGVEGAHAQGQDLPGALRLALPRGRLRDARGDAGLQRGRLHLLCPGVPRPPRPPAPPLRRRAGRPPARAAARRRHPRPPLDGLHRRLGGLLLPRVTAAGGAWPGR